MAIKNNDKIDNATDTEELTETPEEKQELSETETLIKKCDELNEKYLRLMAEYDNFRKRTIKEKTDIYPQATADAVTKFLPVIDNIGRAREFDPSTEDFAKGFTMICENFENILKSFGVEEIGEVGEDFSPLLHNAIMHVEDEALGKNVISQVLQKGYKIGDRVIRFATVQTAN